jgi:phosphatidylglycerophosphatase GEP4
LTYPFYADEVESTLGVPVLRHAIKKPGGGGALLERFQHVAKPREMAMVGDRLFTDILFGNLNGTYTILTRKIISEKGDNAIAARVSCTSCLTDVDGD